nr:2789_t:CDS:10 [Entrophospora candida]CAG8598908.1 287_t:CDS:10 [Entrophospora candida]
MERLDEESADLDYLEENLKKTEELTKKMTSMLNVFDDRLVRLEASILPIHGSTQKLTKLVDNIDKTRTGVLEIIGYFDLVVREEATIKKGPNENDLVPYLKSIGKCKKAMEVLAGMRLKSTAMLQLEELFRKWLTSRSNPIEPLSYITKNLDIPGIPQAPIQNLAKLSSYLETYGQELDYKSNFVDVYSEVRSNYLVKSLTLLAQGSISTAERRNTPVYEKGTCGFNSYTEAMLRMFKTEYEVASKVLSQKFVQAGFKNAIQQSFDNYIETGKVLNNRVRRFIETDLFLAFDILESLNRHVLAFDDIFMLTGKKDVSYGELLHSLKGVTLRSIPEFIEEIKTHRTKTSGLPSDGTIHEMTINTLQHMKRMSDYPETIEQILLTLGDGNWNVSDKDPNFSRNRAGGLTVGSDVVKHYYSLALSLDSKARTYKKTSLTCIFLLNNYQYILKAIRTQFSKLLDPEVERKYESLVQKCNDGYQDTWKACFANLMDYTVVRGTLKSTLSPNDKQTFKEKLKNFYTEFDEIFKIHKGYTIPDLELRNKVTRDIKIVLLPIYNRFLEKFQQADYSKGTSKYIKYDSATLENMVSRLFDGSIY